MMMILQPGLLKQFYDQDELVTMNDFVDIEEVRANYVPGVLQTGMFGDELAGLPVRLNIKSLVWYRNDVFAEQGYEVPETWEEMVALTDEIRGDLGGQGTAPWCVGIEKRHRHRLGADRLDRGRHAPPPRR